MLFKIRFFLCYPFAFLSKFMGEMYWVAISQPFRELQSRVIIFKVLNFKVAT